MRNRRPPQSSWRLAKPAVRFVTPASFPRGPFACRGASCAHGRVPSVTEVANTGKYHSHAGLVGGGDHFRISHLATRLDTRGEAGHRGGVAAPAGKEKE